MEDARPFLRDVAEGCRKARKAPITRGRLAAEAGRREAAARAPVETGRLRASITGEVDPQRAEVRLSFPADYIPVAVGVPSRGIPPNDFAERGLDASGAAMELVLDDLLDAMMGRG